MSWVSRRLALVELLPESIQQLVRQGKIAAQVALKCLVPVARQSLEDCQRMAAIFAGHHCDIRKAGQLYAAWRRGSVAIRERILGDPTLFFKTQRQEKAPAGPAAELIRDLEIVTATVNRAYRRLPARSAWSWITSTAPQRGNRSSGLKNNSSASTNNSFRSKHRMLSQAQRTDAAPLLQMMKKQPTRLRR